VSYREDDIQHMQIYKDILQMYNSDRESHHVVIFLEQSYERLKLHFDPTIPVAGVKYHSYEQAEEFIVYRHDVTKLGIAAREESKERKAATRDCRVDELIRPGRWSIIDITKAGRDMKSPRVRKRGGSRGGF